MATKISIKRTNNMRFCYEIRVGVETGIFFIDRLRGVRLLVQ